MDYLVCLLPANEAALENCPYWIGHLWQGIVGDGGLIGPSTLLLGILLAVRGVGQVRRQRSEDAYKALDTAYTHLLQQRLANPILEEDAEELRLHLGLHPLQVASQRRNHAYMTLTFLETIKDSLARADDETKRVWQPVIVSEGRRYANELSAFWAETGAFQGDFIEFMRTGGFRKVFAGRAEQEEVETFVRDFATCLPTPEERKLGKAAWLEKLQREGRYTTEGVRGRAFEAMKRAPAS